MSWLARKVTEAWQIFSEDFTVQHWAGLATDFVMNDDTGAPLFCGPYYSDDLGDYDVERSWLMFDTHTIGADSGILSASLRLTIRINAFTDIPQIVQVRKSGWTSPIDASQWEDYGSLLGTASIPMYPAIGTNYKVTLSDFTGISKTGISKFALIPTNVDEYNADPGFWHTAVLTVRYHL